MNVHSVSGLSYDVMATNKNGESKKEEVAVKFEKIFARRLVSTLIKDSFKMGDKNAMMGQSNNLYRQHIVNTLADEIARQRKLGIADMIAQYKNNISHK